MDEGLEESLTLHRLGVFALVARSLKTTNVIESVHSMAEQRLVRYCARGPLALEWLHAPAGIGTLSSSMAPPHLLLRWCDGTSRMTPSVLSSHLYRRPGDR
ncbi:MAG: hypothetical protein EA422_00985 [Gemmatimonadales bacterium]|nr:MAG: hypothetical protein EA422_00985 [Gemmatimonadales bacterium]